MILEFRPWINVSCAGILFVGILGCAGSGTSIASTRFQSKADLGKALFFDTSLSTPSGMACATCHSPSKGFTDPRPCTPTSAGVVHGLFGSRNAPTAAYSAYSPPFQTLSGAGAIGGQFWDGRANDLATQAKLPLLNPIEMANASPDAVVAAVKRGPNANGLRQFYGPNIFDNSDAAYSAIADAIAEFEKTAAVSPFTSKYDAFLAGKVSLTASEQNGLNVFNGKGLCFTCHPSTASPDGTPPLFTNFQYNNLGLPKNPKNPFYSLPAKYNPLGSNYVDIGLQVTTSRASDAGRFKTPTLRNIAKTGPYFHNGLFNSLSDVVKFYNTRDTGAYGPPEITANVETGTVGNLGLTDQESSDLVAFMNTLTDGYVVK